MPHKCTKCGKEYPDGDYRILKGCECGNNKFFYVPKDRRVRKDTHEPKTEDEKKEVKIEEFEGIESVKIIAPGMYEIKLENLFSKNGIVIALQEEGRYVIHLPSLLKKKKNR